MMDHLKTINQEGMEHHQTFQNVRIRRRSFTTRRGDHGRCRFHAVFLSLVVLLFLTVACNFYVAVQLPTMISALKPLSNSQDGNSDDDNDDMLHVVTTRFMQAQPHLLDLGAARLKLFETFCLPTMVHQGVDKNSFLWFVMTDPHLDRNLLDRLKLLLRPYPNFYLVASNAKLLTPQNLTAGVEYASTIILTGNLDFLFQRMFDIHRPLLIETRLDADDGLESTTLQEIQYIARNELPVSTEGWQIICNYLHFEWRNNEILDNSTATVQSAGRLRVVREHICTTPGYSLVKHRHPYSTDFPAWPRMGHHLVTRDWPKCMRQNANPERSDSDNTTVVATKKHTAAFNCWTRLGQYPAALRSRTITSAGMSRVDATPEGMRYENQTDRFWKIVERDFGISRQAAETTSQYLKENLSPIILDNLKGQCTFGHSCKESSRDKLLSILNGTALNQTPIVAEYYHE
jgi:hypothetical protein